MEKLKKYFVKIFITTLFIIPISMSAQVQYTLDFQQKNAHLVQVSMRFTKTDTNSCALKMPTWIPGSYLIREFSKNIISINAEADDASISLVKTAKNTWVIPKEITGTINVKYSVYAFEKTVRTSYINDEMALINPTSICLYIQNFETQEHKIHIKLPKEWKYAHSALLEVNGIFSAKNYDELADAPIILGNHDIFSFEAAGKTHRMAMVGQSSYKQEQLSTDVKKIIDTETSIFGENPSTNYLFIVLNGSTGGGGLEHANSTVLMTQRNAYNDPKSYTNFLGLVAHEYFHLWNVKRLRPQELIQYNYDAENHTEMLWFFEGFTSYFDEWALLKAGIIDNDTYLKRAENTFNFTINTPGNQVQSLADASYDAWIKYYRRNENSNNVETSYYTKGAFVAHIVNLELLEKTKGKRSIADLMKSLYEFYYKKQNTGINFETFLAEMNKLCGSDCTDLMTELVYGTSIPSFESYKQSLGLSIDGKTNNKAYLGLTTKSVDGKEIVQFVASNSPAQLAGISVEDELIASNGKRIVDFQSLSKELEVDKSIDLTVSREGIVKQYSVTPSLNPTKDVSIKLHENLSMQQKQSLGNWLKL